MAAKRAEMRFGRPLLARRQPFFVADGGAIAGVDDAPFGGLFHEKNRMMRVKILSRLILHRSFFIPIGNLVNGLSHKSK